MAAAQQTSSIFSFSTHTGRCVWSTIPLPPTQFYSFPPIGYIDSIVFKCLKLSYIWFLSLSLKLLSLTSSHVFGSKLFLLPSLSLSLAFYWHGIIYAPRKAKGQLLYSAGCRLNPDWWSKCWRSLSGFCSLCRKMFLHPFFLFDVLLVLLMSFALRSICLAAVLLSHNHMLIWAHLSERER